MDVKMKNEYNSKRTIIREKKKEFKNYKMLIK